MKFPKRPQRRQRLRVDRLSRHPRSPARSHLIAPDPLRPFVVEVRLARNRRHMREEIARLDGPLAVPEPECMGLVRSWHSSITGRSVVRPGGRIARMYLNRCDLRRKPSEIVAHECTHAGMAWARFNHTSLAGMAGEEVLCYAVGKMVAQLNRIGYAEKVWH